MKWKEKEGGKRGDNRKGTGLKQKKVGNEKQVESLNNLQWKDVGGQRGNVWGQDGKSGPKRGFVKNGGGGGGGGGGDGVPWVSKNLKKKPLSRKGLLLCTIQGKGKRTGKKRGGGATGRPGSGLWPFATRGWGGGFCLISN